MRDFNTNIHTFTPNWPIGRLSSYDLFFHVVQLSEFWIPKITETKVNLTLEKLLQFSVFGLHCVRQFEANMQTVIDEHD